MIITKHDLVSIDPDLYCSDRVVIERQKKNTYIKVDNRKQKEEMEKVLWVLIFLCRETGSEIKVTKKELLEISKSTKSPTTIKLKKFLEKKYLSSLDVVKSIETKEYIKKENLIFDYIEDFPTKANIYFRSKVLLTVPLMAVYNKKEKKFIKARINTSDTCIKETLSAFEKGILWISEDELTRWHLDGYLPKFYCFKHGLIIKEIQEFLSSDKAIRMKLLFVK